MRSLITVALLGSSVALYVGCSADWQKAERSAKEFAAKLPGSTGDVECTKNDTDGDGYCSCSAFMKEKPIVTLDCDCRPYCLWGNCQGGCKVVNSVKMQGQPRNTTVNVRRNEI